MPEKVKLETKNEIPEKKQNPEKKEQSQYNPELNKLSSLAKAVQSEIEDWSDNNEGQRKERWKLLITKNQEWYNLWSYWNLSKISKIWNDYQVLGLNFAKPEEAIKYANLFNFLKNEVRKNWWVVANHDLRVFKNWFLEYWNWESINVLSRWDKISDSVKEEDMRDKLIDELIKFSKQNKLLQEK